jgi:hypothetical protein
METRCAVRRIPIDQRGWPASVMGWETTSDDMGLFSEPEGWSDPAHVELTPMPMVNTAMANVHAAVATASATVVRLNIVIAPSQKVLIPYKGTVLIVRWAGRLSASTVSKMTVAEATTANSQALRGVIGIVVAPGIYVRSLH